MIVAERKPMNEIKGFLENYKKILILGCGTCATVCLAGGETEVKVVDQPEFSLSSFLPSSLKNAR